MQTTFSSKAPYRLGLDLGTNSIGWAILALDGNGKPNQIIDAGVRIFSDGRDPTSKEPLAVARRNARGARRRRDRFLARKSRLMNYLVEIGLMPKDELERKKLELLNPYELRTKALYEALNHYELGRAIFHLNQRRGFKSNRKEIQKEEDVKTNEDSNKKKIKKENTKISDNDKRSNLEQEITTTNSKTLGEYLYKHRLEYLNKKENIRNNKGLSTRSRTDEVALYPTRKMYEDEFTKIQEMQQSYQKISEKNWQEIYQIIFYQRPLKSQDKGFCRFINEFKIKTNKLPEWAVEIFNQRNISKFPKGLPRTYLALPSYIKFRILSEVNNLKLKNKKTHEEINLTPEQKQKIITKLNEQKSPVKFKSLRKLISSKSIIYAGDDFEFNLESTRRIALDSNKTDALMRNKKYFGERWQNFSLEKQDEIVEFLFDENEEAIFNKALIKWQLDKDQAAELSKLNVNSFGKTSTGNMCKEILQKLCEKIEEKNYRFDQALKDLGINHSDEEFFDGTESKLSYYAKAIPTSVVFVKQGSKEEIDHGRISNPTVHVALNQIRKVINSLIKEYGKPTEIHIELARNLKQSKDEKRRTEKEQTKNQKENEKIAAELISLSQNNNYENRLKFKLWKELKEINNDNGFCIFCGGKIGCATLFNSEIEIEHILPFSKTFDDSFANKTIAHKKCNNIKGNRSPFEAFGNSTADFDYQEILNRTKNLPKNKAWRFSKDAMDKFNDENNFLNSQLNDTRYLSKISKQYLSQICKKEKIRVTNGKLTSILRHHWGLNSIIEKNQDVSDDKKLAKKNRDDHRHHAIDAICIAMTETSLLQQISHANAHDYDVNNLVIPIPGYWNHFHENVAEIIKKIIVSHKQDHGKNGQLHEETYYGIIEPAQRITREDKIDKSYNFVYRKNFATLSKNEIERIRDEKIYRELQEKLNGISEKKEIEKILSHYTIKGKNGETKVKRIRLIKKERRFSIITNKQNTLQKKHLGGIEEKTHQKAIIGNNHHIAIWKLPKNLKFLPLLNLKGTKFDIFYKNLSDKEQEQYEKFKQQIEKLKAWISKDGICAVTCSSFFETINSNGNQFKPHPASTLLTKIHNGDLVKFRNDKDFIIAKVVKLNPAGNRILATKNNESGKETKEISLSFGNFKEIQLTKIFITPTGKIFDYGPILK